MYWQWKEFTETVREGHRGGVKTAGTRKLDLAAYNKINAALKKKGYHLELTPAQVKDWDESAREKRVPDVPQNVLEKLSKVQTACDLAVSQAKDFFRKLSQIGNSDAVAAATAAKLKEDFEAPPLSTLVFV